LFTNAIKSIQELELESDLILLSFWQGSYVFEYLNISKGEHGFAPN
jgi:hypothetical protein